MEIRGRQVNVVQYGDYQFIKAEIKLKNGDCRRQTEQDYACLDNCKGNYAYARFLGRQCFSYAALVPVQFSLHPQIEWPEINDLPDLEKICGERGYQLQSYNKGKIVLWRNNQIASYNPCGLDTHDEWFNAEAKQTYIELTKRIDELYQIASMVPFEELLHEPSMVRWLMSPQLHAAASSLFGPECVKELKKLQKLRVQQN